MKWSIKLTQYEIDYHPRPAVQGQAVADFLAKFTYRPVEAISRNCMSIEKQISMDGYQVSISLHFKFKTYNNEPEYKAIINGLEISKYFNIKCIVIYSDS